MTLGEAKYRRKNEPDFGTFPKQLNLSSRLNSRGLIVSPAMEIDGSRLFVKSSNLDPQELRFALLFWDRLLWPSSRAIHFSSNDDELFLERSNVLSRPNYTFNGDGAQGILKGQIQAFQDMELIEPGAWALAQGENSLFVKNHFLEEGKGSLIQLIRAIPIPTQDVPLNEILEFKLRRRDELNLLRSEMDLFVAEIEIAEDKVAALKKSVAAVDKACANILQLGKEWQFPVYLSNLKVSLSLSPGKLLPAVGVGWKLGEPYGLHAASAVAALAGAVSTLEIKADYGVRSIRRPLTPYRYAYQIHHELR
jgi:Family of unknown function (DUF6236)